MVNTNYKNIQQEILGILKDVKDIEKMKNATMHMEQSSQVNEMLVEIKNDLVNLSLEKWKTYKESPTLEKTETKKPIASTATNRNKQVVNVKPRSSRKK